MTAPGLPRGRFGPDFPGKICHARTRAGQRCRKAAALGTPVCRSHGAAGGAPRGPKHGKWKTGQYSIEAVAKRKRLSVAARRSRQRLKLAVKMCELMGMFTEGADEEALTAKNWGKLHELRRQLEALDEPVSAAPV